MIRVHAQHTKQRLYIGTCDATVRQIHILHYCFGLEKARKCLDSRLVHGVEGQIQSQQGAVGDVLDDGGQRGGGQTIVAQAQEVQMMDRRQTVGGENKTVSINNK